MQPQRLKSRRRVFRSVIIILGVPFLLAVILMIYFWRFPPLNREWVVETLEKHYQCDVELKSFSASFFPAASISGEGLVLKRRDRANLPPLASIRKFSVSTDWLGLLRQPRHFRQVRLEGLVAPPETGRSVLRGQGHGNRPAHQDHGNARRAVVPARDRQGAQEGKMSVHSRSQCPATLAPAVQRFHRGIL